MATATAVGTAVNLKNFINGESVDAMSGARMEVRDPATGELVGTVPKAGAEDARKAIDAAEAAFEPWSDTTPDERGHFLHKAHDAVAAHHDELALLLSREQGKPVMEAKTEIEHFLHGIEFYASLASKVRGDYVPLPNFPNKGAFGMVLKQPIGVCVGISPWNFPITLTGTKIGPALAGGNTIVVKPASSTPMTAIRVVELMNEVGIPKGVLNIVTGPGSTCGEELISNPKVRRVAFTGETKTGRHLMEVAGRDFKRVTLELGGKSANVIFGDADLERAAAAAPYAVFGNAGQDCCARSRILVEKPVYDRFLELLVETTRGVRVGDPEDPATEMGPLISAEHREKVASYVDGDVAFQGEAPEGPGFWFPCTILAPVANDSRPSRDEIFGPVACVTPFADEAEAVRLANDTPYGLSGSVWTRDGARGLRVARAIDTGVLSINANTSVRVQTPFGGFKQSGFGRELGMHALDGYSEVKNVFISTES